MYEARNVKIPKNQNRKYYMQIETGKMKIKLQPTICTYAWLATSRRSSASMAPMKCQMPHACIWRIYELPKYSNGEKPQRKKKDGNKKTPQDELANLPNRIIFTWWPLILLFHKSRYLAIQSRSNQQGQPRLWMVRPRNGSSIKTAASKKQNEKMTDKNN